MLKLIQIFLQLELSLKFINETNTEHSLKNLVYLIKNSQKYSIARNIQNIEINNLKLNGITLDLGGGKDLYYSKKLKVNYSVNISKKYNPTHLIREDTKSIKLTKKVDNIISFNTLEHIKDVNKYFEISRSILKKKGTMIIIIPFIHKIHADPDDYNRFTPSWFKNLPEFEVNKISFLVWGPITTMISIIENNLFAFKIVRPFLFIVDFMIVRFVKSILKREFKSLKNYPSSLFITLIKK